MLDIYQKVIEDHLPKIYDKNFRKIRKNEST